MEQHNPSMMEVLSHLAMLTTAGIRLGAKEFADADVQPSDVIEALVNVLRRGVSSDNVGLEFFLELANMKGIDVHREDIVVQ